MKRAFMRIATVAIGMELLLATAIYIRGFPLGEPVSRLAAIWELPAIVLHIPAIVVLTSAGLCCGYASDRVIGDVFINGYAPMTLEGVAILAVANVVLWIGVASAATWLWLKRRVRGTARDQV